MQGVSETRSTAGDAASARPVAYLLPATSGIGLNAPIYDQV